MAIKKVDLYIPQLLVERWRTIANQSLIVRGDVYMCPAHPKTVKTTLICGWYVWQAREVLMIECRMFDSGYDYKVYWYDPIELQNPKYKGRWLGIYDTLDAALDGCCDRLAGKPIEDNFDMSYYREMARQVKAV